MWCGLENRLVAYADDATLFASVPSPHIRPLIAVSWNRDLAVISAWCKLLGMRINPTKTQYVTGNRLRPAVPPHPNFFQIFIDDVPFTVTLLRFLLWFLIINLLLNKNTHSVSSSVAQKTQFLLQLHRRLVY